MSAQEKRIRDFRPASRFMGGLTCRLIYSSMGYEAFVRDLSLKGAFLRCNFIPPQGSNVFVKLATPLLREAVILEGTVVCLERSLAEQGGAGAVTVKFNRSSPELIVLMSKLVSGNSR